MAKEQRDMPQDPESLGYSLSEWRPAKLIVARDRNFTVLKSDPKNSQYETVHLSIRRKGFRDDILRADSYKEGYFSVFWHSSVTITEFLTEVERFLAKFDPLPELPQTAEQSDDRYEVIFFKGEGPEEYNFGRPLTETDMEHAGLLTEETRPLLTLVRMNTPYGDFCYEPRVKRIGVIAVIDPSNKNSILTTTTEFVTNTQGVLTPQIVANTLNRLPYLKQSELKLV